MLGSYDFCGHYDWTFMWLEKHGTASTLVEYWDQAIFQDSQDHATREIIASGLQGMEKYWGHTLHDEAPGGGYSARIEGDRYLMEMKQCPSRGFLLMNGIEYSRDYCDHCIGWIGPLMKQAGYKINHAHNHCGQCYWEFVPKGAGKDDDQAGLEKWKRELMSAWEADEGVNAIDVFCNANAVQDKQG